MWQEGKPGTTLHGGLPVGAPAEQSRCRLQRPRHLERSLGSRAVGLESGADRRGARSDPHSHCQLDGRLLHLASRRLYVRVSATATGVQAGGADPAVCTWFGLVGLGGIGPPLWPSRVEGEPSPSERSSQTGARTSPGSTEGPVRSVGHFITESGSRARPVGLHQIVNLSA